VTAPFTYRSGAIAVATVVETKAELSSSLGSATALAGSALAQFQM
jgi:hypothetical protein